MIRQNQKVSAPPVPPRPSKTVIAEALAKSRKLSPVRVLYATGPDFKINKPIAPSRTAPPIPKTEERTLIFQSNNFSKNNSIKNELKKIENCKNEKNRDEKFCCTAEINLTNNINKENHLKHPPTNLTYRGEPKIQDKYIIPQEKPQNPDPNPDRNLFTTEKLLVKIPLDNKNTVLIYQNNDKNYEKPPQNPIGCSKVPGTLLEPEFSNKELLKTDPNQPINKNSDLVYHEKHFESIQNPIGSSNVPGRHLEPDFSNKEVLRTDPNQAKSKNSALIYNEKKFESVQNPIGSSNVPGRHQEPNFSNKEVPRSDPNQAKYKNSALIYHDKNFENHKFPIGSTKLSGRHLEADFSNKEITRTDPNQQKIDKNFEYLHQNPIGSCIVPGTLLEPNFPNKEKVRSDQNKNTVIISQNYGKNYQNPIGSPKVPERFLEPDFHGKEFPKTSQNHTQTNVVVKNLFQNQISKNFNYLQRNLGEKSPDLNGSLSKDVEPNQKMEGTFRNGDTLQKRTGSFGESCISKGDHLDPNGNPGPDSNNRTNVSQEPVLGLEEKSPPPKNGQETHLRTSEASIKVGFQNGHLDPNGNTGSNSGTNGSLDPDSCQFQKNGQENHLGVDFRPKFPESEEFQTEKRVSILELQGDHVYLEKTTAKLVFNGKSIERKTSSSSLLEESGIFVDTSLEQSGVSRDNTNQDSGIFGETISGENSSLETSRSSFEETNPRAVHNVELVTPKSMENSFATEENPSENLGKEKPPIPKLRESFHFQKEQSSYSLEEHSPNEKPPLKEKSSSLEEHSENLIPGSRRSFHEELDDFLEETNRLQKVPTRHNLSLMEENASNSRNSFDVKMGLLLEETFKGDIRNLDMNLDVPKTSKSLDSEKISDKNFSENVFSDDKKVVKFSDEINHEILIKELENMRLEQERLSKRQRMPFREIYDGSSNIFHSEWQEVSNGKQIHLSSCQISLDESTKMSSLNGLPPLPKSLSGINLDGSRGYPGPQTPSRASSSASTRGTTPSPGSGHLVYPPHSRINGQRKQTNLDQQLAVLRREMYSLRQLDLTLLSQLYSLNEAIQDFRQMLQEDSAFSPISPTPSQSSGDEADEFYSPQNIRFKPPTLIRKTSNSSSANSSEYGTV